MKEEITHYLINVIQKKLISSKFVHAYKYYHYYFLESFTKVIVVQPKFLINKGYELQVKTGIFIPQLHDFFHGQSRIKTPKWNSIYQYKLLYNTYIHRFPAFDNQLFNVSKEKINANLDEIIINFEAIKTLHDIDINMLADEYDFEKAILISITNKKPSSKHIDEVLNTYQNFWKLRFEKFFITSSE